MDEKRIYEACAPSRKRVEASGPRLNAALRQKVNSAISSFLQGQFWDKPYQALNQIETVLEKNGLRIEGTRSADLFRGNEGTRLISVFGIGLGDDEMANTVLRFQWGKAGDQGRFDVTAYLS